MKKMKLGIYGGTFNPPHIGHITAAEAFSKQMELDKLLIIPDYLPPHKVYSGKTTAEQRLEMCKLAFSHITNVEVSDIEIARGGKSYTYETLERLRSDDVDLYLLCGSDMIATFDTWCRFEYIFEMAAICYARREKDDQTGALIAEKCNEYRNKYGARIYEIGFDTRPISSTELRGEIYSGKAKDYISPAVLDYIEKNGLYK